MTVAADKKPMTVVSEDVQVTDEQMAARIQATREQHGAVLQQYHEIWYNSGHTWHFTHFAGVGMMKSPTDLWVYHELLWRYRPQTIIETGTYKGGSALWFAFLMDVLGINGHVYTIDIEDYRPKEMRPHPKVTFLGGDSTDPLLRDAIAAELPGDEPRLIVLDADHSAQHVYDELCLWAPLVHIGDWLIVEDTNISWPPVDRGARGGLEDYLREHPGEFRQDILSEKYLLSMAPGGWLQRMKVGA